MYPVCQELVSRGDVVEMGDTLVLETSAFEHESSTLSIPTKKFMETWPSGLRHRTANAECPRKAPSVRIGSSPPSVGCVGATGLPYRAVNPELFRTLRVRILPHPPGFCTRNQSATVCSRSLIGKSSRLSIEQMPVRIRSAAPTALHAVG